MKERIRWEKEQEGKDKMEKRTGEEEEIKWEREQERRGKHRRERGN